MELTNHIEPRSSTGGCASCSGIPEDNIRAFLEALTATVYRSIAKAEPDFLIPVEGTTLEGQAGPTREATSPPKYSDMPNADVILLSSDLVQFRVHKSALVASPFFRDMFSLPHAPNDAAPDELPVMHLSEDAEVLNSLISMLYPVHPEIPSSIDNILALLAAVTKYGMDAVQVSIRTEVRRRGPFLPTGTKPAEVFRSYAIAYSKGLIPEVATAARLTLGYPLTFESLGDSLRFFEGWALRELADFRLRSIDSLRSNWESFSDYLEGPSKFWVGCPTAKGRKGGDDDPGLPGWLQNCLQLGVLGPIMVDEPQLEPAPEDQFTETIPTYVQLYDKYSKALQRHVKKNDCHFCMKVHVLEGGKYCAKMKKILAQAWDVPAPTLERLGTPRMAFNSSE